MNEIINSQTPQYRSMETFKSKHSSKENNECSAKVQLNEKDPFMKWPLRGLAYTNELGECLRPVIGSWAWAFWAPAVAYIGADVADKYKKGPDGNDNPSTKRAMKQASFQTLASVILPTAAVKLGNYAVDRASAFDSTKLALSDREKITNSIVESMSKGTHNSKSFVDPQTNKFSRELYIEHLVSNFKSKDKNAQAGSGRLKGLFKQVYKMAKRSFTSSATEDNVRKYTTNTVNEIMDVYDNLKQNVKPEKMSDKAFKMFKANAEADGVESSAFKVIEKMQKQKIFKKNKVLIAAGGFVSLGLLMKPIDKFVENTLIEKYIEPTINNFDKSKPLKSFTDAVNFQRRKRKETTTA